MANETKHTPGPWVVEPTIIEHPSAAYVTPDRQDGRPYGGPICTLQDCEHIGGITVDECKANARLIAAAPDMLEALEALLGAVPPHVLKKWPNITKKARAAIAKAEGR